MKQILNKLNILALVCFAHIGWTQSLDEFINKALENNYQIRIAKNEAKIASNNNTSGNAGQLPTIDLAGTASTSLNNTKQALSDGSVREGKNAKNSNINVAATANWTVFNGFKIQAKKEQLNLLAQLGEQDSKFYIEQTVSDIVVAYHQLVYQHAVLDNYKQSLGISSYRLALEKKRKDVGAGKTIDYSQALVDYQTDSIRFLAQKNQIKSLEIELNRLLNNPLENELLIDLKAFTTLPFPDKDSLVTNVMNYNSQLGQNKLAELITETEVRMANADRYPKIDLFAGYQFANSFAEVGFVNSNRNLGPQIGVSLNFNLFNGGKTNLLIENSSIYNENATLTNQQMQHDIEANVLSMFFNFNSIKEQLKLAENNVTTLDQVIETASEQLKRGAINGYDFRLTQLSMINARLTLMQLQYTAKAIEINLNRLSGSVLEAYL